MIERSTPVDADEPDDADGDQDESDPADPDTSRT